MKMLRVFFILIFSSCIFQFSYSQNRVLDSLQQLLSVKKEDDSIKVDLLNMLCWNNISVDAAKSKNFCEESIKLAEKLNYKKGLSIAVILMATIFFNQGNYEKCLEMNLQGLKIREEIGDEHGAAGAYANIGDVYGMMNQTDKALEYHLKSLDKFRELYSKNPNNDDAFDIAVCLLSIGEIYKGQNKNNEAMKCFQEALTIFEKLQHMPSIANCLSGIGNIYYRMSNIKQAVEYNFKALNIYKEESDKLGISNVYLNLSTIFMSVDDYEKAIQYADSSLSAAKEISLVDNMKSIYELLSHVHEKKGNYQKAYEYHKLYSDTKDSLLNEESSKQITEMQTKYETEKKEQQITLLNKEGELQKSEVKRQKIIIWSVAGGLMVVLILSIFIFRERRKSEKLLLNILPAETARELKENGKATAKHYQSVTVMFTDFKGFTNIVEKLSAEELVSELDFLFKKFDEIISKYPIEKIKTIGDAYMCAGGLPTANSTNAMDVVNAALEIQGWMKEQNNKWQLRIGIHTGAVTAGVVGDKKFAYDIWGDTVNTASRMESSGEAGKVNISGTTYAQISSLLEERGWEVRQRGKIPAKNKGEIEMYFVERMK